MWAVLYDANLRRQSAANKSHACLKASKALGILLQRAGVDVNLQDRKGDTALILASRAGYAMAVVGTLLNRTDIKIDLTNRRGLTALHATSTWLTAKLLVDYDAAKNNGSLINAKDEKGSTALMLATERGRHEIVRVLLSHPDVDVNADNGDGYLRWRKTALIRAASQSPKNIALFDREEGLLIAAELLVTVGGADVNRRDWFGNTALHWALLRRNAGMVAILLNATDADVLSLNKEGRSPLSLAAVVGDAEVIRTMLHHPSCLEQDCGREAALGLIRRKRQK